MWIISLSRVEYFAIQKAAKIVPLWQRVRVFTCLLPAFSALAMFLRASLRTDIFTIVI